MAKSPTPQAVSRLLKAAGFSRSELFSPSSRHGRRTAGFHVHGGESEVYAGWQPATPLLIPSAAQAERDAATALEMAGKYAEAITKAGWNAEVIHLAGPLVRVTAKEGPGCACGHPVNAHDDGIGVCGDCHCNAYQPQREG